MISSLPLRKCYDPEVGKFRHLDEYEGEYGNMVISWFCNSRHLKAMISGNIKRDYVTLRYIYNISW